MGAKNNNKSGFIAILCVQVILLILFWLFVRYGEGSLPSNKSGQFAKEAHTPLYPHFQDIHVMIYVGFGFLMTFLRKYGYSATGFTLLIGALVVQWTILVKGYLSNQGGLIHISLDSIIDADIAAAVPLISFGALLGRTTPVQLLFMALIEVVLFAANEHLQLKFFSIADAGGSITVHAFGAYFGLAASLMLRPRKEQNDAGKYEGSSYTSDIFAMIGTLFLWIYWPSFNSVLPQGTGQERAILNTYFSLAAAAVAAFVVSAQVNEDGKLEMVHVQNSTLAGGVAVGAVCHLLVGIHGAILIGLISGAVSVIGYRYISPLITETFRIHDTCGINNLHGMPAIISALASAIYAWMATTDLYKEELPLIYPAMGTRAGNSTFTNIIGGYNRTASAQAGFQLLGIAVTVVFAIISGIIVGLLMKLVGAKKLEKEHHHQDEFCWIVAEQKED